MQKNVLLDKVGTRENIEDNTNTKDIITKKESTIGIIEIKEDIFRNTST